MNNVVKRNMDVLHRIVIPKNMLKEAGIENSSVVIMREENGVITLEKAGKITRNVDELGRVVIPKELREPMGIKDDDQFTVGCKDGKLVVRRCSALAEF